MSIRPAFAEAILSGSKQVEFRKRRLAPDVSTVLIYSTLPVGLLVGAFEIVGYDIASPTALWERHKQHAGIARAAYRDYYRGTHSAVGILLKDPRRLALPMRLTELDEHLRAPQSFAYMRLNPEGPTGLVRAALGSELELELEPASH